MNRSLSLALKMLIMSRKYLHILSPAPLFFLIMKRMNSKKKELNLHSLLIHSTILFILNTKEKNLSKKISIQVFITYIRKPHPYINILTYPLKPMTCRPPYLKKPLLHIKMEKTVNTNTQEEKRLMVTLLQKPGN